jgi:hypothetical protein
MLSVSYCVIRNTYIGPGNIAVDGAEYQMERKGKKRILVSKFCVYVCVRRNKTYII